MEDNHIKTKAKKVIKNAAKDTDDAIIVYTAPLYFASIGVLYFLYIITFLGVVYINPNYIKHLSIFVRIIVSLFLIFRFNPFRDAVLHKFDANLILAAAALLIIDLLTTEFSLGIFSIANIQKSIIINAPNTTTKLPTNMPTIPLYISNIFTGFNPLKINDN
jgi:hypothetical protein